MQKNLAVSSSPHLRDHVSTRRIMQEVCLALAPAGIAGIILFGSQAAVLIAASVISAVLAEYFYQKLTHQKVTVGDWSAVVTGLLLAYNLPANAPVWLAVVGAVIAIVLVKQIFGGIGSNFMNPALAARAILFVSWATQMTTYPATRFMLDGVSTATPLNSLGTGSVAGVNLMDLFLACRNGTLDQVDVRWKEGAACCLVLASGGYPGSYAKGYPITGLEEASQTATVFHAGTKLGKDGAVLTNGGRVLGVTATGPDLEAAIQGAYVSAKHIHFIDMHYRTDIGRV